jgi:hypothetical protein
LGLSLTVCMLNTKLFEKCLGWQDPRPGALGAGGVFERYAAYRPKLHFLTNDSSSSCESFGVDSSVLMLVINVGLARTAEVQLVGQGIVEFHYRVTGSLEMAGSWGRLQLRDPSLLLWYQPRGCHDVREIFGGADASRELSISVYCDPQWLKTHALDDGVGGAEWLRSSLRESEGSPVYQLLPPHAETLCILTDIISNPFNGHLRYLYARSKGAELLCRTLAGARHDGPERSLYRED